MQRYAAFDLKIDHFPTIPYVALSKCVFSPLSTFMSWGSIMLTLAPTQFDLCGLVIYFWNALGKP
jgi:hypothetical protein